MERGRPSIGVMKTRLGREVRRARKAKGLTLQGLAEVTGLSLSTIQAIETGDIILPGRDKLKALAGSLEPETSFTVLTVLAYEDEPVPA